MFCAVYSQDWSQVGCEQLMPTCTSAQVDHPNVVPLAERRLTQQQLREDESRLPHDQTDVTQVLSRAHAATCGRPAYSVSKGILIKNQERARSRS